MANSHYIKEIYLLDDNIIDIDLDIKLVNKIKKEVMIDFIPLEVTTIIDIFISNSEKAESKEMIFEFNEVDDKLNIKISDN